MGCCSSIHKFQLPTVYLTNNCPYIQVSQEWELDNFKLHQTDEDIHTAIERRLKVTKGRKI